MRTVRVGDRDVTVEEPSIAKVEEIGKKLAAVGKDAPEIQIKLAQFVASYEKENVIVLDRHTAKVRVPNIANGLSESDWKAMGQKVRLPRSPSGTEQLLAIMPYVFDKAREQALEVVALLMIPDDVFEREADVANEVKETKQMLRFRAKPSQLIALLSECTEIVKEVMDHEKESLGNLRSFWDSINGQQQEPQSEHEAALAEAERELGAIGVSQSSTDSPPDTAGAIETSEDSPVETPSLS